MTLLKVISTALLLTALSGATHAQQASASKKEVDTVDIAKKLANPIADMISVPLQYEFSRGVGKNQAGL